MPAKIPPATRIPTPGDFAPLAPELTVSLVFPSPPESTTAILLLFHGFGDSEVPFADFARKMAIPGVLAISVRGPRPLPLALVQADDDVEYELDSSGHGTDARHFHWADDVKLLAGELDLDPGFEEAAELVAGRLVRDTLVDRCGWTTDDVILLGFGQGGSFALGLASLLRVRPRVVDMFGGDDDNDDNDNDNDNNDGNRQQKYLGVVSICGPLPPSTIPSASARQKAATPVLVCHGYGSEAVDDDAVGVLLREFGNLRVWQWAKANDDMPSNREEMWPIMRFFAERLDRL